MAESLRDSLIVPEADPGPVGIGGWLLLPLLGLIISPLRVAYELFKNILPAFAPQTWGALTTPGGEAYHPLWATLILFEAVSNSLLILASIALLVMFLRRHRLVPKLMIAWLASWPIVLALDVWLAGLVPAAAAALTGAETLEMFRAVLGSAIWILYFVRSKRVRNTFTR
jgi:hypothetical protein